MKSIAIWMVYFAFSTAPISRETPEQAYRNVVNQHLSLAIVLCAQALGQCTTFDPIRMPTMYVGDLGQCSGRAFCTSAEYDDVRNRITLNEHEAQTLRERLHKSLYDATPEEIMSDVDFQKLVCHELGHVVSEQLSRKMGLNAWISEDGQERSTEEARGVKVTAEGVSMWFEQLLNPTPVPYPPPFPKTQQEFNDLDFRELRHQINYEASYWLVADLLNHHGQRGLEWLIAHPLRLSSSSMYADAEAYRSRGLAELAAGWSYHSATPPQPKPLPARFSQAF